PTSVGTSTGALQLVTNIPSTTTVNLNGTGNIPAPTSIPTNATWGLLALLAGLLSFGMLMLYRRTA
ncbi:MAG: hypothetical protein ACT4NL_05840, partial [Pseudomarimonas sp.]